jgi:competence protein ComEC
LPAAICLIAGIALHPVAPTGPMQWLAVAVIFAAAAALGFVGDVPLLIALICTGIAAAQLETFYFPSNHIALFTGDEPQLAMVQVRLDEAAHSSGTDGSRHVSPKVDFVATVLRIRTWSGWVPATGQMRVSIGQPIDALNEGDRVELVGAIQRPPLAANPGQMDWARIERLQRIATDMHVTHASAVRRLAAHSPGFLPIIRQKARRWLASGFSPPAAVDESVLSALVFGDHEEALHPVAEDFRRAGLAHLLASNGLRIAVLAAGIYLLATLASFSPRRRIWITVSAVAAFAFLTVPAAQAIRPVLLCVTVAVATAGRRIVDSVQILSVAAIIILLASPLTLYSAGFQLGFAAVLGLMLFSGPVAAWLSEWEDPHRRFAGALLLRRPWQRILRSAGDALRRSFAAALVAWLIVIPIVAFHYEQFNPWAIPLGICLAPLVFLTMVSGFLKILLTAIVPALGVQWAPVAALPADLLARAVAFCSKIPGGNLAVTTPSPAALFLYYALLCAPALVRLKWFGQWTQSALRRWGARCAPACAGIVLLLMPLDRGPLPPDGALRVTLLSVGAGQCAVVEAPDNRVYLFDCGSSTLSDALRECLEPFLRHEGREHVDVICLSHGDFDHISAAAGAYREFGVNAVWISPFFRQHAHESVTAGSLLEMLDDSGDSPKIICRGGRIDLGKGAELSVLWPPSSGTFTSNNAGLVMRLTYAGRSILFPADIQAPPERELLKTPGELTSDVLVAPHHGSFEESTGDFVRAVHPRFIVSSNSNRLSGKQRSFDDLPSAQPLYRTNRCGALVITISQEGNLKLDGFLGLHEEHGETARGDW